MDRRPKTSFLGPATWDQELQKWTLLLLPSDGHPISLHYDNRYQAYRARKHLGDNPLTYRVETNELLLGIYHALQEALSQAPPNTSPDVE